jgi:hypothetical protein
VVQTKRLEIKTRTSSHCTICRRALVVGRMLRRLATDYAYDVFDYHRHPLHSVLRMRCHVRCSKEVLQTSSGLSCAVGSSSNTSAAAPAIQFSLSALKTAFSCQTGPRAALMMKADFS